MKHTTQKPGGFTLLELLVVITVVTLLAGLTIATMNGAQSSAARNRAKAEIAGLSAAIESYKVDNGDYPRDTNTDGLDIKGGYAGGSGDTAALVPSGGYMLPSLTLYIALSADTDRNRTLSATEKAAGRVYFPFKSNMLYPRAIAGASTTVTALIDPFRNAYGYSTKYSADMAANPSNTSPGGINPTFDLWSTGDKDQKGHAPAAAWITNW